MQVKALFRSIGLFLVAGALLASGAQAQLQVLDKNDVVIGPVAGWLTGVSPIVVYEDGSRKVPLYFHKTFFQTYSSGHFTNTTCSGKPWVFAVDLGVGVYGMQNVAYAMRDVNRMYRTQQANPVKTRTVESFFRNGQCSVIGSPFPAQVIRADRLAEDFSSTYQAPFRVE